MHWILKQEGGPRRVNHAAVALGDKIYSFGGYCSGEDYEIRSPLDVFVLDTFSNRWTELSKPQPNTEQYVSIPYQRYGHTAVVYGNKAYIWGGRNDSDGASSLVHQFEPVSSKWSVVPAKGQVPPARDGHSACVIGDKMIIFGGFEEEFQRFSQETYAFDFNTGIWTELVTRGTAPAWRDFHTATPIGNRMYIFGGRSDSLGQFHSNREIYFDKLKFLDLDTLCWQEPITSGDKPEGRRSHSAWCYEGRLYIFGGYIGANHNKHFNSLHQFDPGTSTWCEIQACGECPQPRRRQCTVLVGNRVFLFGGTMPCPSGKQLHQSAHHGLNFQIFDRNLVDLSDLYVLDYSPSLKSLSLLTVGQHSLHEKFGHLLPWDLRLDLAAVTQPNRITVASGRNESLG